MTVSKSTALAKKEGNIFNLATYKEEKFTLDFAIHEPIHCMTPGLFRSLKKGDRKKLKLEVIHEFGKGEDKQKVEYYGPEPLGADDLRILQCTVALAGRNHKDFVSVNPKSEAGRMLRDNMKLKWDAINEPLIVAKGSFRELAKEIGWASENLTQIQKCLERLCKVTIFIESKKRRMMFNLISGYGNDSRQDKLFIALNPLITRVIFGSDVKHTRIDLCEVRKLSDVAVLLHQRLCSWIDPGAIGKVSLDTIIEYVWYEKSTNINTIKDRKRRLKMSLLEFEKIQWVVKEYSKDKFSFQRPIRKSVENKE